MSESLPSVRILIASYLESHHVDRIRVGEPLRNVLDTNRMY